MPMYIKNKFIIKNIKIDDTDVLNLFSLTKETASLIISFNDFLILSVFCLFLVV